MSITTEEHIRVRAYHLWEADGRPDGRDLEFWERAQQSLANGEHHSVQSPPKASPRRTDSQPATTVKATAGGNDRQPAQRRRRTS